MPGKKHVVTHRKTHHRTKGEKIANVTPQPKPVKRESTPPLEMRGYIGYSPFLRRP